MLKVIMGIQTPHSHNKGFIKKEVNTVSVKEDNNAYDDKVQTKNLPMVQVYPNPLFYFHLN
jgi:hypothetical protein